MLHLLVVLLHEPLQILFFGFIKVGVIWLLHDDLNSVSWSGQLSVELVLELVNRGVLWQRWLWNCRGFNLALDFDWALLSVCSSIYRDLFVDLIQSQRGNLSLLTRCWLLCSCGCWWNFILVAFPWGDDLLGNLRRFYGQWFRFFLSLCLELTCSSVKLFLSAFEYYVDDVASV